MEGIVEPSLGARAASRLSVLRVLGIRAIHRCQEFFLAGLFDSFAFFKVKWFEVQYAYLLDWRHGFEAQYVLLRDPVELEDVEVGHGDLRQG